MAVVVSRSEFGAWRGYRVALNKGLQTLVPPCRIRHGGIGKGIAQVLAEAGADVAINALTPRYVEPTAAELADATGRRVIPVIADVTHSDGVQHAIDTVMHTFGRIDVLVNNLGDAIRKPLVALPGNAEAAEALSDDELTFVMDINLTEAILCTRAVGPHMLERGSGKVINISSWTAGQGGGESVAMYDLETVGVLGSLGYTAIGGQNLSPWSKRITAKSKRLLRFEGEQTLPMEDSLRAERGDILERP